MTPAETEVREIRAEELVPGQPLREAFLALHDVWIGRGLVRWLALLRPDAPLPALIVGAFDRGRLDGVVLGIWSSEPCPRFDALFDITIGPGLTARPASGAWHLVSVTTAPSAAAHGLGRHLLARVLSMLAATGHAEARTLSPALDLPHLAAVWPGSLEDAVLHAARPDGRPVMQVMRLHLGGGARLEAVLRSSRGDDAASGFSNLRFRYATDPTARAAQKERWQRWVAGRSQRYVPVLDDYVGAPLVRAVGDDRLVWDGPAISG